MQVKSALTPVIALLGFLAAGMASLPASAAIRTMNFTGVLTCYANCSSPNIALNFSVLNAGFSGSYTYDDSIQPYSITNEKSTYLGIISFTVNIKSGAYVLGMNNGDLFFRRNSDGIDPAPGYDLVQMSPTWFPGGTGTFVVDTGSTIPISFVDTAPGNILPSTLVTAWPQTPAAWAAPAFAGVTIGLSDRNQNFPANLVVFRGKFLTMKRSGEGMDVDGNGTYDALTDGLLMIRYLFGLRGNALIANAIGANATRTTSQAIEVYLASMVP